MIFVYNSIFIFVLGYLFKGKWKNNKIKKSYIIICFFQMFLIQTLRDINVGTDTIMYVNIYENFLSSDFYAYKLTHFEIGFQTMYRIFHILHINARGMLGIISFITMVGYARFIYKNSRDVWISVFVFSCMFFPNSLNILRQYLSMAIALNAYDYMKKKRYITASIIVISASLIHILSILAFIPMIFKIVKNWNFIKRALFAVCALFYIFSTEIVTFFLMLFGKTYYLSGFNVNRLFRMTTLITFILAILSWYFTRKEKDEESRREMNVLSCVSFVNMIAGILYLKFEFMSRIIEALNLYLLHMLPLGVKTVNSRYISFIKLAAFIVPFFLMLSLVYNSSSGIENYKFFFCMRC